MAKKKPQPKTIGTMTSEELGLALSREYSTYMQTQANINAITAELQKRINEGKKDGTTTN